MRYRRFLRPRPTSRQPLNRWLQLVLVSPVAYLFELGAVRWRWLLLPAHPRFPRQPAVLGLEGTHRLPRYQKHESIVPH